MYNTKYFHNLPLLQDGMQITCSTEQGTTDMPLISCLLQFQHCAFFDKMDNGGGAEIVSFNELMWKQKSGSELKAVLIKWRIESTVDNKKCMYLT